MISRRGSTRASTLELCTFGGLLLLFIRCNRHIACHRTLQKIPNEIKDLRNRGRLDWVSVSRVNQLASRQIQRKMSVA
jgi:hypothetical protein